MSIRISIKLTNKNDWVQEAIEKEMEKTGKKKSRVVENILVKYFKPNA